MSDDDKAVLVLYHVAVVGVIVAWLSGVIEPLKQLPFGQFKYYTLGVLTLLSVLTLIDLDVSLIITRRGKSNEGA